MSELQLSAKWEPIRPKDFNINQPIATFPNQTEPKFAPVTARPDNIQPIAIFPNRTEPLPTVAGRLLTPAEGCGFSQFGVSRIVGGGPARNGTIKSGI